MAVGDHGRPGEVAAADPAVPARELTGGRAGEDEETQGTRKSATARGDRWATRDPPGR
ncbi:predicted protein [Streptomyces lividans TK24]|nr:predicted protein [Streptomyces lividans TK24]